MEDQLENEMETLGPFMGFTRILYPYNARSNGKEYGT